MGQIVENFNQTIYKCKRSLLSEVTATHSASGFEQGRKGRLMENVETLIHPTLKTICPSNRLNKDLSPVPLDEARLLQQYNVSPAGVKINPLLLVKFDEVTQSIVEIELEDLKNTNLVRYQIQKKQMNTEETCEPSDRKEINTGEDQMTDAEQKEGSTEGICEKKVTEKRKEAEIDLPTKKRIRTLSISSLENDNGNEVEIPRKRNRSSDLQDSSDELTKKRVRTLSTSSTESNSELNPKGHNQENMSCSTNKCPYSEASPTNSEIVNNAVDNCVKDHLFPALSRDLYIDLYYRQKYDIQNSSVLLPRVDVIKIYDHRVFLQKLASEIYKIYKTSNIIDIDSFYSKYNREYAILDITIFRQMMQHEFYLLAVAERTQKKSKSQKGNIVKKRKKNKKVKDPGDDQINDNLSAVHISELSEDNIPGDVVHVSEENIIPGDVVRVSEENIIPGDVVRVSEENIIPVRVSEENIIPGDVVRVSEENIIPGDVVRVSEENIIPGDVVCVSEENIIPGDVVCVSEENIIPGDVVCVSQENIIPGDVVCVSQENIIPGDVVCVSQENIIPGDVVCVSQENIIPGDVVCVSQENIIPGDVVCVSEENIIPGDVVCVSEENIIPGDVACVSELSEFIRGIPSDLECPPNIFADNEKVCQSDAYSSSAFNCNENNEFSLSKELQKQLDELPFVANKGGTLLQQDFNYGLIGVAHSNEPTLVQSDVDVKTQLTQNVLETDIMQPLITDNCVHTQKKKKKFSVSKLSRKHFNGKNELQQDPEGISDDSFEIYTVHNQNRNPFSEGNFLQKNCQAQPNLSSENNSEAGPMSGNKIRCSQSFLNGPLQSTERHENYFEMGRLNELFSSRSETIILSIEDCSFARDDLESGPLVGPSIYNSTSEPEAASVNPTDKTFLGRFPMEVPGHSTVYVLVSRQVGYMSIPPLLIPVRKPNNAEFQGLEIKV
ncbi:hypothetical protein CDAR_293141 [Caerostris darwini]|uniref:Uncharacterized protein n=1 Tax=Caerostris darwini TaxID=1538125 RepID=A0AAV4QJ49_9ARAC|nr:hypothetical protein CDAR_293141 [Caerostris darwini]